MLDETFIRRKIEFIQRDLIRLEEFKDKTFDEIAKDWRSFAVVKNLLAVYQILQLYPEASTTRRATVSRWRSIREVWLVRTRFCKI